VSQVGCGLKAQLGRGVQALLGRKEETQLFTWEAQSVVRIPEKVTHSLDQGKEGDQGDMESNGYSEVSGAVRDVNMVCGAAASLISDEEIEVGRGVSLVMLQEEQGTL